MQLKITLIGLLILITKEAHIYQNVEDTNQEMDKDAGGILDQIDLNYLSNTTNGLLDKIGAQLGKIESEYRKEINYLYK